METISTGQEGRNAYEKCSRLINGGNENSVRGFVDGFLSDHNTLQTQTVALFLSALYSFGESTGFVDARNEFAHEICQKVKALIDEQDVFVRDGIVKLAMI